jgi:Flp pilus assembly pilin Flp
MKLKAFLKNLWNDERGQSTTEYILILSVVVMIAIKFKKSFGDRIERMVGKLGEDIETNINSSGGN